MRLLRIVSVLLCGIAAVACSDNSGNGENNSSSHDISSSSGTSSLSSAARFIGTWKVTSGMSQITCPGMPTFTQSDVGGVETVTEGADSDTIVVTSEANGCTYELTVSGNTATAAAGQICHLSSRQVCDADAGVDTSKAVIHKDVMVSDDGVTMRESWTVTFPPSCNGDACTGTGTDTLTKQ